MKTVNSNLINNIKMEATPKIVKGEFTADVNSGMTKAELIAKYKVSSDSIKQIAKMLNLTIKRAVAPKFILVDDVTEVAFESIVDQAPSNIEESALNN